MKGWLGLAKTFAQRKFSGIWSIVNVHLHESYMYSNVDLVHVHGRLLSSGCLLKTSRQSYYVICVSLTFGLQPSALILVQRLILV